MTRAAAGLRRLVYARAAGWREYCGIPEAHGWLRHQIDHVIPQKHGGRTDGENLALSCVLCNRRKGSDLASIDPLTGRTARLYNPRTQRWPDHFRLEGAAILPLTAEGRVTVGLLQLNDPVRVEERQALIRSGAYMPGAKP